MNKRFAGVAVPVFSLRSKNSLGAGEFSDIKPLVDWAVKTGLKAIQILPINDTTSTGTWMDSYPYSSISAFALHPIYIDLAEVAGEEHANLLKPLQQDQKRLNASADLEYEEVVKLKMKALRVLYEAKKNTLENDKKYLKFVKTNKDWLKPYAIFCSARPKTSQGIPQFYYFVQYYLHIQLKEVSDYAHKMGILLKGDIAIGINKDSADFSSFPMLFNEDMLAGAPPDFFSDKGQNWGFPNYNWKEMQKDNYAWWRQRLDHMSRYFDAFRLDHILGFFRIWSIPANAVEAILGRFIPAIPIHLKELKEKGITFDHNRYCKPYITDEIVKYLFKEDAVFVKDIFLDGYELKPQFDTQKKVLEYFNKNAVKNPEKVKQGLFDLINNVIFIEEPSSAKSQFHFNISMDKTSSFQSLDEKTRKLLQELYHDYFYTRQENLWKKGGKKKLSALKKATNMLVCGEDLGMIPACVPGVLKELKILSLEVQRMPEEQGIEFSNLKDAPYLSVVTPGTHDMSTIREWWEEDRDKSQRFYNSMLDHVGTIPYYCEPYLVKEIIAQHLNSPAMLAIFQIQDLMGVDGKLRRQMPQEERINDPANANHNWKYRMHISLEELMEEHDFNNELRSLVKESGR